MRLFLLFLVVCIPKAWAELYFSDAISTRFFALAENEHTRLFFDKVPQNESLGYFSFQGKTFPVFYLRGKTESSVQIAVGGEVYKADRRGRFEIPVKIKDTLTQLNLKANNLQNENSEYEVWVQYQVNAFTDADPLPLEVIAQDIVNETIEIIPQKWEMSPFYYLSPAFLSFDNSSFVLLGHRLGIEIRKGKNGLRLELNSLLRNLSSLSNLGLNGSLAEYNFTFEPSVVRISPGVFVLKNNYFSQTLTGFDWNQQIDFLTFGLSLTASLPIKVNKLGFFLRYSPQFNTLGSGRGDLLQAGAQFEIPFASTLKLSFQLGVDKMGIEDSAHIMRSLNHYFMGIGLKL